jgi:fructokinase
VQAVSTVGAGDSFAAAFLTRYLNGKDILSCMQFAAKVSAFVVSETGAVPDYNPGDFE